jgi:hypothetical protein
LGITAIQIYNITTQELILAVNCSFSAPPHFTSAAEGMDGLSTFSELAGYASIGCWLGAQFPYEWTTDQIGIILTSSDRQVVKNIHTKSSEGLALPFLANWLAGASFLHPEAAPLPRQLISIISRRRVELGWMYINKPAPLPGKCLLYCIRSIYLNIDITRHGSPYTFAAWMLSS